MLNHLLEAHYHFMPLPIFIFRPYGTYKYIELNFYRYFVPDGTVKTNRHPVIFKESIL